MMRLEKNFLRKADKKTSKIILPIKFTKKKGVQ